MTQFWRSDIMKGQRMWLTFSRYPSNLKLDGSMEPIVLSLIILITAGSGIFPLKVKFSEELYTYCILQTLKLASLKEKGM